MNIRVLDKNDKAALEQLIYTIENALPVPEWWIPIDDIERSHFFDADWTCFLGAFNDDNELVAASALFFNEHEFAEEAEKLGLDIRSTNVAEVGRCMVTLTSAVTTLCVSLTSASVQLPATAASTQSSP